MIVAYHYQDILYKIKVIRMIFKKFQDLQLSTLGFGAMRLPIINENMECVDQSATDEMIEYAITHGINYFDTAYIYTGSEEILGSILKKNNVREQVTLKISRKDISHYSILVHTIAELQS